MNKIIELVLCHLVGDYVLQLDFIAHTKGTNWYHLFVHCALYVLPFYILFGLTWQLVIIFLILSTFTPPFVVFVLLIHFLIPSQFL